MLLCQEIEHEVDLKQHGWIS